MVSAPEPEGRAKIAVEVIDDFDVSFGILRDLAGDFGAGELSAKTALTPSRRMVSSSAADLAGRGFGARIGAGDDRADELRP